MVMYLKSSFSINSYDGCTFGCKYCILSTLKNRKLRKISDEKDVVEELINYKYYNPQIPITINNSSDPFQNAEVFESSLKILKYIKEYNLPNTCVLISKGYLNKKQVQQLSNLNMKLICLYTLSGLSQTLENRNLQKQIKTIKLLSKAKNLTLMHYYRPIIEGVNSDEKTIKSIVKIATKYFKASIISGIRINSHLKKVFNNLNIKTPFKFDTEHKYLSNETYNKILKFFKEENPDYLCFKKTSCGLSYLTNMPDYNGHSGRIAYCSPTCPSYNICFGSGSIGFCDEKCPNYKICKSCSLEPINEEKLKSLLKIIGKGTSYHIENTIIKLDGEFMQEDLTFLRHNLKRNVKADITNRSNDEPELSK